MQQFDLIVVGAGPAGSATAFTAARAGLSVALLDKTAFPRNKLCGGLFSGRSKAYFEEIFETQLHTEIFEERNRIGFYYDGKALGSEENLTTHVTMRLDMDHHMLGLAISAGAQDFTGIRIDTLDIENAHVCLRGGPTLGYKFLIGADGVNSLVARTVFGRSFDPAKIGFALEVESPVQPDIRTESLVRIDFNAAAWGYGWSFPKRGSTTVGLGGLHALNPDMKDKLTKYRDLLDDSRGAKIKGHFLPFGDYKTSPGQGNILLVGDAAGFVDPITGEGIAYAMKSGQLAARAIAQAVHAGNTALAYQKYKKSIKWIFRSLWIARLVRPIIFGKSSRSFFVKAFSNSRAVKQEYLQVLSGQSEYPRLLWLLMRRLPMAFFRDFWRT